LYIADSLANEDDRAQDNTMSGLARQTPEWPPGTRDISRIINHILSSPQQNCSGSLSWLLAGHQL